MFQFPGTRGTRFSGSTPRNCKSIFVGGRDSNSIYISETEVLSTKPLLVKVLKSIGPLGSWEEITWYLPKLRLMTLVLAMLRSVPSNMQQAVSPRSQTRYRLKNVSLTFGGR